MNTNRPLPNDVNAERALLGMLIAEPTEFPAVQMVLWPEDFFVASHQRLYALLGKLDAAELRITVETITAHGKGLLLPLDQLLIAGKASRISALSLAEAIRGTAVVREIVARELANEWLAEACS